MKKLTANQWCSHCGAKFRTIQGLGLHFTWKRKKVFREWSAGASSRSLARKYGHSLAWVEDAIRQDAIKRERAKK